MISRYFGPEGLLHYLEQAEFNDKPPLVLLSGLTCHAHYWAGVWPALSEDFTLYALDWRGHGLSNPAESYRFEDYRADLAAFLSHVGAQDAVLVGHSLGGYVALDYAAHAARPPRAVVACDVKTSITPEELEGGLRAAAKGQQALPDLAEAERRLRLGLADGRVSDEVVATLARAGTRENGDGTVSFRFDRKALALEPLDPFAFVSRVQVPVLVMNGANSAVMDDAAAGALTKALPQGRHVTLPDAGHHAFLNAPEAFSAAVIEFAAQLAPAPVGL